jgi:hypothetical protein
LAKKKEILIFEPEIDFDLIAITATTDDYKISIEMNRNFDLQLALNQQANLKRDNVSYSVFSYQCDIRNAEICIIANKTEGKLLLTELRQVDFLIRLKGTWAILQTEKIIAIIKQLPHVQAAIKVDVNVLKDAELLTFELPDVDYQAYKAFEKKLKLNAG